MPQNNNYINHGGLSVNQSSANQLLVNKGGCSQVQRSMSQDLPNFDTLLKLAKSDPEQLETIRKHLACSTINAAPKYLRPRLRGLQFRIDAARQLAKSPMDACVEISEMMYSSFEELRLALNAPLTEPVLDKRPASTAEILPFQPRQNSSSRHTS